MLMFLNGSEAKAEDIKRNLIAFCVMPWSKMLIIKTRVDLTNLGIS
jgi:hypothetical protein